MLPLHVEQDHVQQDYRKNQLDIARLSFCSLRAESGQLQIAFPSPFGTGQPEPTGCVS
jgi:hypothetical protein